MLASGQLTSSVARPEKHPHEHYRAINTLFSLALALLSLPSPSPSLLCCVLYIRVWPPTSAIQWREPTHTLRFKAKKIVFYGYYHEFAWSSSSACKEAKYVSMFVGTFEPLHLKTFRRETPWQNMQSLSGMMEPAVITLRWRVVILEFEQRLGTLLNRRWRLLSLLGRATNRQWYITTGLSDRLIVISL